MFWGCFFDLSRISGIVRNSDTFRIRKAECSFPIAIAPKLLQYGSCNHELRRGLEHYRLANLRPQHWSKQNIFGFCGPGGRLKGNRQIPIWSLEKMGLRNFCLRHYLGFGGCGSGQPHPIGPFTGTTSKIFGFRLEFREKPFFSSPKSGTEIWAILGP